MIPSTNIIIAMALIVCITFRLKLVGLLGSFFLKKYIYKYKHKAKHLSKYKATKKPSELRKAFFNILFYLIIIGGIQHDG